MQPNIVTKLYHFEVYMPEAFKRPVFEGELFYSAHAKRAALDDRYGAIVLPRYFNAEVATLIEVETEKGVPVKQLWRQPLDEKHDLVLAIQRDGLVRTVWINVRNDAHTTLQAHRYEKPKVKH